MTYCPRDLLDKFIDEETAHFKKQYDGLQTFLEEVEKEIQPFFKAIKKFADTGVADLEALKIEGELFELDQENAGAKKHTASKKMATLKEHDENIEIVKIKKEKISDASEPTNTKTSTNSTTSSEIGKDKVKTEKEDMPAPTWIPPKKKPERSSSRNTRTKGKKAAEANKVRDSDVIVQNSVITTINLTDTEDSDNEKLQKEESTTRRTKTVTRKQAIDSGAESDTESRHTRSKVKNKTESDMENVEVQETRSTRTKTLRKGIKVEVEEIQPETRSTRTKTIRKEKTNAQEASEINQANICNNKENTDGKKAEEESAKSEEEESQPETRSTRTKTIRKEKGNTQEPSGLNQTNNYNNKENTHVGKKAEEESAKSEAEESQPETRSTRTKTIRKEKGNTQEPSGINQPNNYNDKEKTDIGNKAEEDGVQSVAEECQPETRSTRTKTIRKDKGNIQEPNEINPPNNPSSMENADVETTRSTRTKTRKQIEKNTLRGPEPVEESRSTETKSKRNRNSSEDDVTDTNNRKKSKSNSPVSDNKANTTSQTVYEDACSTPAAFNEKKLDATFVAAKPGHPESTTLLNATVTLKPTAPLTANSTVVAEPSKYNIFDKNSNHDIFTEDEDEEVKTPPKKAPIKKSTKEVFSPYEKTTLKKKVEAFEKLQNGFERSTTADCRMGRGTPLSIQEKAKVFTPSGLKFMPSSCSTAKVSRLINSQQQSSSGNTSIILSSKSAQKDPRERQRRLLEREQALKKKEAMLLAQAEAKRKLNEEKQLKAQQQRKVLEAEKKKQLEVQKQRELEREEQSQKFKQELDKKRLAQKKKLKESQAQNPVLTEQTKPNKPIYMITEPPQLPTDDCYDSDDPAYKRVSPPAWCVAEMSKRMQLTMLTAGEKIKNTLFCRHAQTPDLQEIFETIDPKKLKRTSSMLWRRPPRYTMMPDLNETKFSDDEELYESD